MKEIKETIGFIGAGNMATALISGLINSNHSTSKIIASSPEDEHLERLSSDFGVHTTSNNQEVLKIADLVILAVKPNIIEILMNEIKNEGVYQDIPIISIAAGVKIKKLESYFGESSRIIRAMPNTPASIMEGVTAISPNKNALSEDIENAKLLFKCVGIVTEIKEKDLDIFTALIGSGPAYVFYLIESLLESSENLEVSREEKIDLTIVGPEQPLAIGIVDLFRENGLLIFGPNKFSSQLESSKEFSKIFMKRNNIPTARFKSFSDFA